MQLPDSHRVSLHRFRESVTQRGAHFLGGRKQIRANAPPKKQTNADKRKQTQANAEAKTQANASKRGQTQANAQTLPPLLRSFAPPLSSLQSPKVERGMPEKRVAAGPLRFEERKLLLKNSKRAMVNPSFWAWIYRIFFSSAPNNFLADL